MIYLYQTVQTISVARVCYICTYKKKYVCAEYIMERKKEKEKYKAELVFMYLLPILIKKKKK